MSSLAITLGSKTRTKELKKTVAELSAFIQVYLSNKVNVPVGLTGPELNDWYLDQFLELLIVHVKDDVRRRRLEEERNKASLTALIDAEVDV
jgi:hypothetical protein